MNTVKISLFIERIKFHLMDFYNAGDKEELPAIEAIKTASLCSEVVFQETTNHDDDAFGDLAFEIYDDVSELLIIALDWKWNGAASEKLTRIIPKLDNLASMNGNILPSIRREENEKVVG